MPVPITSVSNISPQITQVYGQNVLPKMQAIQVTQGQTATINWTMLDPAGNGVNLSGAGSVNLNIFEATFNSSQQNTTLISGTIVNATSGAVTATLTADVVAFPGISFAEFDVLDYSGNMIFANQFYLAVNYGLNTLNLPTQGPPSIAEIRLHLRDNAPEDNFLLDTNEFDLAEIVASIIRPIQQFNEMPPPLDQQYNTANFPWRYYWLEAIIGNLFMTAAHNYRRNHLPYSAAGLTIDDKNKEQNYLAAAKLHIGRWEEWAHMKKVQINMDNGWLSFGSDYDYYTYGNY